MSNRRNLKSVSYGFTLMELMIVMVLLGILVAMGASSFVATMKKGRDNRRKGDLKNITTVLEEYFNDKGKYPNDDGAGHIMGCYPDDLTLCSWGSALKDKNNTVYMIKLPADPLGQQQYYYDVTSVSGVNKKYQIYTRLEHILDGDLRRDGSDNIQYYNGTDCGAGRKCNYGLASPNMIPEDGHSLTTVE